MKDLFEKLFANPPLAALALGAVFIGLGALGGIPINIPITGVDSVGRIALYAVGIVCLIIAILPGFGISKSSAFPRRNFYGLIMDEPQSTSTNKAAPVEGITPSIGGKYRVRPPDGTLRLFVYDHLENKYWPQNHQNIRWEDRNWTGKVMIKGTGYEMTVIAALVPPSGQVLCDYYFEMGRSSDRLKSDIEKLDHGSRELPHSFFDIYWRPFVGNLPDDFIVVGKVKVIRVR